MAYFEVVVSGPAQDLHSGVYGGSVHEPLNDLIHLLATLRHPPAHGGMHHERIRVPGLLDDVPPVTDEERAKYATLDFDVEQYNREDVTGARLENATNEKTLMARWRFPTLSIHGIEGAFSDPGAKTVLPRRVSGKFSIRQVPNMTSPVVWKSSSGQRRVDGAESPRHRADATEASRRWRGASEI